MDTAYNALAIVDSIDNQAVVATMKKINQFQSIVKTALQEGKDYGKIPGAGDKPSLLKPGAEKINMLFGLCPQYKYLDRVVDFERGFFNYEILCTLERNGSPVAQGVGSCNSHEIKYRYNNVDERKLEELGIPKDQAVQFTDRYGRTKYRIETQDPADKANTILKMAKKRAYVDATLQVASLSDLFTQDLEDMTEQFSAEAQATMTIKEAGTIKVSFGKHKGESLGQLYDSDRGYLEWLQNAEKTDPVIRKAITIIFDAAARKTKPAPSAPAHEPAPSASTAPAPADEFAPLPDEDDVPF